MATNSLILRPGYFPLFDKGRPIASGQIYIGEPDLDPEVVANQKAIVFLQEDGTEVAGTQPVEISGGGMPTYNGSPVSVLVDGDYSVKVLDKQGTQIYYVPRTLDSIDIKPAYNVDTLAELSAINFPRDGESARVLTTTDAGLFRWTSGDFSAETTADPDQETYVPSDAIPVTEGVWVRVADRNTLLAESGASGGRVYPSEVMDSIAVNDSVPAGTAYLRTDSGLYFIYGASGAVTDVDAANGRFVIGGNTVYGRRIADRPEFNSSKLNSAIKAMADGSTVTIVCLGDSITAGQGATAGKSYPAILQNNLRIYYRNANINVVQGGISGNTSRDMINRFETDVVANAPDIVVIMAGMNDLIPSNSVTVEQYANNMAQLYNAALNRGYGVLALDITPRWRADIAGRQEQDFYRRALRGVVAEYRLDFVPLYDILHDLTDAPNGYDTTRLSNDGTHYTDEGYNQIGGAVTAFGMANAKVNRGVGEFMDVTGGNISPNSGATVVFDTGGAADYARLVYTAGAAPNEITLFVWVDGYRHSDLVIHASREQRTDYASSLNINNISIEDSTPVNFTLGVTGGANNAAYAVPFVASELRPGMNIININNTTLNEGFVIDKFGIMPRTAEPGGYYAEAYSLSTTSYYDRDNVDKESAIIEQHGRDTLVPSGKRYDLGDVTNSYSFPDWYAFYLQIREAPSTKIYIGLSNQVANRYKGAVEIEISPSGTAGVVDVVSSIIDSGGTAVQIASGTATLTADGDMHRVLVGQSNSATVIKINGTQILSAPIVSGVGSLIVLNETGLDVAISSLFRLPKGTTSSTANIPKNGEGYVDPNGNLLVRAINGMLRSVALT